MSAFVQSVEYLRIAAGRACTMPTMSWGGGSRRGGMVFLTALVLIAACAFAPAALAQTPAGVDEYQPNPPGGGEEPTGSEGGEENEGSEGPTGGGGGDEGPAGGEAPTAGSGELGDGGGGELPFTGYPLTTLVLIVLILLVAGLVIRAIVARKRSATA